jgi:hypothetical protein
MALELEGRIAQKLNVQTGTSARGVWSKQEFILEYQEGNFPAQVCMNVWGEEKVRELDKYQVGDKVKVSVNLSSREYNGRWYTETEAQAYIITLEHKNAALEDKHLSECRQISEYDAENKALKELLTQVRAYYGETESWIDLYEEKFGELIGGKADD